MKKLEAKRKLLLPPPRLPHQAARAQQLSTRTPIQNPMLQAQEEGRRLFPLPDRTVIEEVRALVLAPRPASKGTMMMRLMTLMTTMKRDSDSRPVCLVESKVG